MRLHEVENPLLVMVDHAKLRCMEKVELQEVTHDTANVSKHDESLLNVARQ